MKALPISGLLALTLLTGCVSNQSHNHKETPIHEFSERERALAALEEEPPNWSTLVNASKQIKGKLTLATDKHVYPLGEKVEVQIDIPVNGYLNILTIDAKGNNVVLFPNDFHKQSNVAKGVFSTTDLMFDLIAAEPTGETILVAIVTKQAVNLYTDDFGLNKQHTAGFRHLQVDERHKLSHLFKELGSQTRDNSFLPANYVGDLLIQVESKEHAEGMKK